MLWWFVELLFTKNSVSIPVPEQSKIMKDKSQMKLVSVYPENPTATKTLYINVLSITMLIYGGFQGTVTTSVFLLISTM